MDWASVSGLNLDRSSSVGISALSKASGSFQPLITLPQFVMLLARSGIRGPNHLDSLCLDQRGQFLSQGKQFTVFEDRTVEGVVIKRINADLIAQPLAATALDHRRKDHLRTIWLEIFALSHQSVQLHPNITKCLSWGFDYPTRDRKTALPVLFMEKASCSLLDLLESPKDYGADDISFAIRHQLCLDVLEGLVCLHKAEFVHGDIKPANVLIFKNADPLVPFVAKLNDFGMCIPLQEDVRESYESYGGTRDWLAPELMEGERTNEIVHKKLFYKCDVFAFGLLVLSIFFRSGNSPFKQDESSTRSVVERALHILESHPSGSRLDPDLTSKLGALISTSLDADPDKRPTLHRDLLATSSPEFFAWLTVHERLTAIRNPTTHQSTQMGSRHNDFNSAKFWSNLDLLLLEDLENYITPDFDPKRQQSLPGEVLLGMAASISFGRHPGFQKKYAWYIIYAAHALSPAAQGIGGRLLEALDLVDQENCETRLSWLRKAVSTGSLTAAEDLAPMHPEYFREAKQAFRNLGGYNDMLHANRADPESSSGDLFEPLDLTTASPSQMCKSIGAPDLMPDSQGNRLLHYAATYRKSSVIKHLVSEEGASVNAQDYQGETPLYKACLSGDETAVRTLIQLHANAKVVSKTFNISCLHWLFNFDTNAIRDVAKLLIVDGKADVNARIKTATVEKSKTHLVTQHFPFHWPFGTPLHWAVAARSQVAADALLELGADIDAFDFPEDDNDRQTALTMAMYRHDAEMVEYLLNKGAASDYIDSNGRNLVHYMAADHSSLNRAFRLPRSVWSWISHGSEENHLGQLRRCLLAARKSGVDINLRRQRSQTPLIDAIENEDACGVLVLLEAEANPDILCPTGESILQRWLVTDACRLDYPGLYIPVLSELLNRTRNIDYHDRIGGETVCHYSAKSLCSNEQFEEVMSLLLACNPAPSLDARDRYGATPFLNVLRMETKNISVRAESLIQRGADIELKTNDGEDFLHCLCSNIELSDQETLRIANSLLARYVPSRQRQIASESHSNRDDSTALMKAVRSGKLRCVKLLAGLDVDINALDTKKKRTALDWAMHEADIIRASFIESPAWDSLGIAERVDAIEDRTVFSKYPGYGHHQPVIENQYVNAPAIIEFLESLGAKRAKNIIDKPGEVQNPLLTDIDLIHFSNGGYIPSKQPFLDLWTRLYQLAWDEHRHTSHPKCVCCDILKFLPAQLRDQHFTPTLLEEISKFQPSFKDVEDLLPKG